MLEASSYEIWWIPQVYAPSQFFLDTWETKVNIALEAVEPVDAGVDDALPIEGATVPRVT